MNTVLLWRLTSGLFFFFFNDTATTEIYTLSLHDALPILERVAPGGGDLALRREALLRVLGRLGGPLVRSEEHTSELQSQSNLVCRLLLEKKKLNHPSVSLLTLISAYKKSPTHVHTSPIAL